MRQFQIWILSLVIAGALADPLAAQPVVPQPIVPPLPSNADVAKVAVKDAASWSRARWNKMKARWALDKVKWRACRDQASARNLHGRKSWPVIAHCMTQPTP
jgi:hypothetical protein